MSTKRWFLPDNPHLLEMLGRQADDHDVGHGGARRLGGRRRGAGDVVRDPRARSGRPRSGSCGGRSRRVLAPARRRGSLHVVRRARRGAQQREGSRPRDGGDGPRTERPGREMVGLLAEAVGHLADAFRTSAHDRRRDRSGRRRDQERTRIEHAYRAAMSELLQHDDVASVFSWREVYRRLSRMGDLVHTVAERVWYSVVKEA